MDFHKLNPCAASCRPSLVLSSLAVWLLRRRFFFASFSLWFWYWAYPSCLILNWYSLFLQKRTRALAKAPASASDSTEQNLQSVFLFLDLRYPHCYQPRTYSDLILLSTSPQERNSRPARPKSWLSWFFFASDSTLEELGFRMSSRFFLAYLLTDKNLVRIFLFWAL
jgi:hypothetical protein